MGLCMIILWQWYWNYRSTPCRILVQYDDPKIEFDFVSYKRGGPVKFMSCPASEVYTKNCKVVASQDVQNNTITPHLRCNFGKLHTLLLIYKQLAANLIFNF